MNGIKLYNILLNNNFTREEAMAFIEHLEGTIDQRCDDLRESIFVTKEDVPQAFSGRNEVTRSIEEIIDRRARWMVGLILGQPVLILIILYGMGVIDQ